MPDFGIFRGFNDKLFGDKLYAGQLPTQLGIIGSEEVFDLLLDKYVNAAAAYSLRKLRSAYTGSAIRVRRTDLEESDIGFTSSGELDTTALLAFTGTGALDNGFIKTWYDQSGNSRNANQTTLISQPQIVSSGSLLTKNGNPAIDFDGSDDFFLINSVFTSDANISGFVVASSDAVSTNGYIYDNSNTPSYGGGYTHRFLNTGGFRVWGQSAGISASGGSTTNGVQYLSSRISTTSNGETNTLYQNGTQTGTNSGTPPTRSAKTETNLGRSEILSGYLNGQIQEIVTYSFDQSSNRTGIETNINNFYSIY
jgi:hypothetical protein